MKPFYALAVSLTFLPLCAHADSLFPGSSTAVPNSATATSLFSDTKARRVGDTLTILINENANAASQANTKTSKSESLNYGPGFGPLLHLIKNFGVSGSINDNAAAATNRTDTLTAQIAVVVKQVLPNGNLVVEGHRSVGINAETQNITLSGIVRPQDVTFSNTIQSSLVADAQIKFDGKGPVGDKQHEGIITRIFKVLF